MSVQSWLTEPREICDWDTWILAIDPLRAWLGGLRDEPTKESEIITNTQVMGFYILKGNVNNFVFDLDT